MQNLWWNFWKTVKIETRFDLSCARFINPWSNYCKSLQLFSIRIFHIISETPKKTLMFEFILKFVSIALLKEKKQFIFFIKTLSMIKYFTCIDINSIHAGNQISHYFLIKMHFMWCLECTICNQIQILLCLVFFLTWMNQVFSFPAVTFENIAQNNENDKTCNSI